MNVLIVDDEQLARQRLRKLLSEVNGYQIVGEAETGEDAIRKTQAVQPDVVLMDIRMPGMDGIEAASYINRMDKPPAIIFTTAFGEHALQAFETHAIDYLLKPVAIWLLVHCKGRHAPVYEYELSTYQQQHVHPHGHHRKRGHLKLSLLD